MSESVQERGQPCPRAFRFWFRASARSLLLIILLALCRAASAQSSLHPILVNGPASNRLNIVIFSEGYTSNQLSQFAVDATNAVNALLAHEPYAEYSNYFNAWFIPVASLQSGSSHPVSSTRRNTYFNSSYDAVSDYLITIPPNAFDSSYANGQGKVDALSKKLMPQCDLPILLVNDINPGGSDGFDKTAISATEPVSMPEILTHETGHVIGSLGDEYARFRSGFPDTEEPNTTQTTNLANIKWNAWIPGGTPIPTPTNSSTADVVGLFEGAHYHTNGWYRPKLNCLMSVLGYPFCEVCSETLVLALYAKARPVDAISPAANVIRISPLDAQNFAVTVLQPATQSLQVQWLTNGVAIPGETNLTFTLPALTMINGTAAQQVSVQVTDPTSLVRNDPSNLLSELISWTVMPTIPARKGTYAGLFSDTNGRTQQGSGAFTLATSVNGQFSGRLQIGATRYSFTGQMDAIGRATGIVPRNQTSGITMNFHLDPMDTDHVAGSISSPNWSADLDAHRNVFDGRTSIAPQSGQYTLIIPADAAFTQPIGDGWASVSVDISGRIRCSGSLPDGTRMTESSVVSKEGNWPLYIPLYGGQGSLQSWIAFANTGTNDLGGSINWIKPALPKAVYYPGGVTNSGYASGSRYSPPARGSQLFQFSNAALILEGAGLAQPVTNHLLLGANNTISSTNKVSMTLNSSAGTFSGKVPNGASKTFVLSGVVLTNSNEGRGYFTSTNLSGFMKFVGE
ncbi:MAG: hypothetical protein C5B50_28180 [Verrucomicrobia bacterium]|nr:MAG: hypothetical protein C5B50_28180 [Verrucomicrobiota bacterium]